MTQKPQKKAKSIDVITKGIFSEIRQLIEIRRQQIAVNINSEMTYLYWNIGMQIQTKLIQHERAAYGKKIVVSLAEKLTQEFGSGWSEKHLRHCLRFAEIFPNQEIVSALRIQLSWSHIKSIIYIDDELKRSFYIEMCKLERWSTRMLNDRIKSMLYERTAISKKPEETIKQDIKLLEKEQKLNPDLVFRDPYFLDFLGLKDTYSEKDLENSILVEIQNLLLNWVLTLHLWQDKKELQLTIRIIILTCSFIIVD